MGGWAVSGLNNFIVQILEYCVLTFWIWTLGLTIVMFFHILSFLFSEDCHTDSLMRNSKCTNIHIEYVQVDNSYQHSIFVSNEH